MLALVRLLVGLLVSCTILGIGIGMLLTATLGSDGFSTMINGISLALDVDFFVVNCAVGVLLVAVAWTRGVRPGLGTWVAPVVVGVVVSVFLALVEEPDQWWLRATLLVISLPVVAIGVAGYLAQDAGAAPAEAAALALDPPLPFRWSYGIVQGGGALVGWLCGAAVGPGTLLVVVLLGPLVTWCARTVPVLRAPTTT